MASKRVGLSPDIGAGLLDLEETGSCHLRYMTWHLDLCLVNISNLLAVLDGLVGPVSLESK